MSISRKIRTKLGHYHFMQEIKRMERKPEIVSFDEASRIGVLYDATDERDSESVKNYVKSIRTGFKKDILAMGYVDRKTLPSSQFAQFGIDFFTRKDLNFRMIPSNPVVRNFINEKFDILINVNSGKCFPLHYITAMSNARFRVGRYNASNSTYYDMMIQLTGEPGIKTILEEIEHFLRVIKKS